MNSREYLEYKKPIFSEITQKMSNNTDYIISLCQQLANEGKVPTLGLVRNKATRSLTIPEIMQVLRRWKENPAALSNADATNALKQEVSQGTSLEERVTELEKEVAALKKQLRK